MENGKNNATAENGTASAARHRVPWWMWAVIIVAMAPGLTFPWLVTLITSSNPVVRGLTWFYPAYVLCSGLLAWQCYGRRTLMSWIIIVLLLLSHLCFYYLACVSNF